eukprot:11671478-Prorocentrum_lima.AAC.1
MCIRDSWEAVRACTFLRLMTPRAILGSKGSGTQAPRAIPGARERVGVGACLLYTSPSPRDSTSS